MIEKIAAFILIIISLIFIIFIGSVLAIYTAAVIMDKIGDK